MIYAYYISSFIISLIIAIVYVYRWQKRFDVNISAIMILIPIVNLAYYVMYTEHEPDVAGYAFKVIYMGGCYLPWFTLMCVFDMCKISLSRVVRVISFIVNTLMYSIILTIGHLPLFYEKIDISHDGEKWIFHKTYGPMHSVFYVYIAIYFIVTIITIIYSYMRKKEVSRKLLTLLYVPLLVSIMGYALNHFVMDGIEIMPVMYLISEIVYVLIARRVSLYEVNDMMLETMVETGDTGFITVDFKYNYLGSNETAKEIFPEINDLIIDKKISKSDKLNKTVVHWIKHFEEEGEDKTVYIDYGDPTTEDDDKMYAISINYLYDGRYRKGYLIYIVDDTQNQMYIRLLDRYNEELEDEVKAKTESIIKMHDNLILSMATMVESRDNSTGGHIRRTSEGVNILIDEIRKQGKLKLSDEFCTCIIKAAPMHDLGKIAVDDAILRKPGRFRPEEYEIMKSHAAEGAKIVHEVLKETDDEAFKQIAENVAHYHHERWDGSGYPDGLKGEEIPLEARIMAIADVYDALVSKRVYKEKMSFEEADAIITEGMGTQFDPGLKAVYEAARPRLEEYYTE